MNQQRNGSATWQKIFLLSVCSLPALCAFYMMWTHWLPGPLWDEWGTPGAQLASYYRGTLSFAELFSQHNESRKFFPRLLYLPISIAAGWDMRHYMVLTFALVCGGSASIYQLVRQTSGFSPWAPLVFAGMNFLLFSPRQYESFLCGVQGEPFAPAVALTLALLMNLSDRSFKSKTLVNAALAFLSTYTFANGMLIWLLAFPLETAADLGAREARRRIFWRVVYLLMATASIASYFISYRHPPIAPPVVSPFAQPAAFLRFVLVWIGSLFSVSAPAICGAVVLFLFGGLMAAAIWRMRRTGAWRSHYPWLILGSYTVISGCVTAMGRLGFGYSMAADVRYTAFSAFLYIAVLGLGFSVYLETKPRAFTSRIALPTAAIFFVCILTLWAITFKKERRLLRTLTLAREHSLLVVRWSEAIPQNPEIALLSPFPRETVGTIRTLAEHDALRPRLVSQKLASAINQRPEANAPSAAGTLDGASIDAASHLTFQGWARVPDQDRPADCVVLGFETSDGAWQPFCVVETGGKRSGVARLSQRGALARAGFSGKVDAGSLPRGEITLKAWAIDLQNERVFPVSGEAKLQLRR
jgi:hypothetical protein